MKKKERLYTTGKIYSSVAEMIGDTRGPEERKKFEDMIAQYTLGMDLSILRVKANLTEKDMAARMGVSKKVVLRIEDAISDTLTIADIKKYLKALGVNGAEIALDLQANTSHIVNTLSEKQ